MQKRSTRTKTVSPFWRAAVVVVLTLLVGPSMAGKKPKPRLVQLDDHITVRLSALESEDSYVDLSWSQRGSRSKSYLQTAAKAELNGEVSFINLFIDGEMLPDFKAACEPVSETTCSVTVSEDFQFGQNKKKTVRFLVYHDRSNCPYQHRFVTTATVAKFVTAADEMAEKAGENGAEYLPMAKQAAEAFADVSGLAKSALGNYLRNMDGSKSCD